MSLILEKSAADVLARTSLTAGDRYETPEGNFLVLASDAENADVTTAGGKLRVFPDQHGGYPSQAFGVLPAAASPTPADNATAFQAWVNAHPGGSTVYLPGQEIPLGAGIDFGARSVVGRGPQTKLTFTGLADTVDAVTLSGADAPFAAGARAGQITDLVIDVADSGRDAIRWTGGIGVGAMNVTAMNVKRDAFHFEQSGSGRYFERAFLENCDLSSGAGRYGLCIVLGDFGTSDTQFFNKSSFRNTRITNAEVADVALFLNDSDGAGNDTKIGGGIKFDNFHAQYHGEGPNREGCAIYVERASTSISAIDWIKFEDCTFEWNAGSPDANGALKVVDNATGQGQPIRALFSYAANLNGYTRLWDYQTETPPVGGVYEVIDPLRGVLTNMPRQQFGTEFDSTAGISIGAGSTVDLFDAADVGAVWVLTAKSVGSSFPRYSGVVMGSSAPQIQELSKSGNLTIAASGSVIQATNTGGSEFSLFWSATRA